MNTMPENPLRLVLYEGPGAEALVPEDRTELLRTMLDSGYSVTCTGGSGSVAPADDQQVLVLGHFTDTALTGSELICHEIGDEEPSDTLAIVEKNRETTATEKSGEWLPWFPVIDYDRCTNCMQCLSFCLFGVYGVDTAHQIEVRNEDKCKTNCPACSRVCPEAAIMFPKYRSGPVNGDEVSDEGLASEKMKIDVSALLGGDIYSTLRKRTDQARERFAKERDEERALKERKHCLTTIQKDLDIPADVLMSLPSLDEIQRRSKEAQAAAEAARKASVEKRLRDRDGNYE
ncbi:MAG: Pyruvate/2-oxoacid:ferredoxin oxidoreductase delta subunit [Rhodothermales bacterium]|jgi:Pyruvate/2-oxoacid:ferredoxin oxidoreductase delta subunit